MRTNIGTSLDAEIVELHSQGNGQKLIARILSERHGLRITHTHTAYAFKRIGLKPHIGSSNGAKALWASRPAKPPGQKLVDEHHKVKRAEQRKVYRGLSDLPLFTKANIFKTRYRNEPTFRSKSVAKVQKWKRNNPEKAKHQASIYWAKWTAENPERAKEIRKAAARKAAARPENKVIQNLRKRLRCVISGRKGYSKTAIIKGIGCTRAELIAHIERQFQPGMSWDNYGEWHIDHITPLASAKVACFDKTVANLARLNHHTNLQPLWAADNIKKGAVMPTNEGVGGGEE